MIIDMISDETTVLDKIRTFPVGRSFPRKSMLSERREVVAAPRHVLEFGSIPFSIRNEGLRFCYEEGWLHAEPNSPDGDAVICVFPSKLHQKYETF